MLLTVSGAVARPGVVEAGVDSPLDDVLAAAGGVVGRPRAVLVGGYYGTWVGADGCAGLRVGEESLATVGARPGTGVIAVLPTQACGIAETARVLEFLARESARQCGPCEHGLGSVAATAGALATRRGHPQDAERLRRWAAQISGRGACKHPDGAVLLLRSALATFDEELANHLRRGACAGCRRAAVLPTPEWAPEWR